MLNICFSFKAGVSNISLPIAKFLYNLQINSLLHRSSAGGEVYNKFLIFFEISFLLGAKIMV